MYLSTGPHLSHAWLFQEHKATLGFSVCTTLTEMFCSISSSTSSAPQQQPEQKENTGEVYVDLRKKEYPYHKWPALTARHDAMKSFSRDVRYTLKKWLLYITWPKSSTVLVTSPRKRHERRMKRKVDSQGLLLFFHKWLPIGSFPLVR